MPLTLGLRPRWILDAPGTADEVHARIRETASVYTVEAADRYLVIKTPKDRQHFWSPQLQVELEDRDGAVHVNGLITPMPSVWTMFALTYGTIVVLGFFGGVFGLAQLQLGQAPYGLYSIPVAALLLAAVYGAAQVGQRLGHEQMEELTEFLEACL